MFKVICIDDKNKPNDIPSSKWIKAKQTYTVIEIKKMNIQGGLLGFKLEEVNLDGCAPYQFYAANRFRPVEETPDEVLEKELELTEN